MKSNKKAFSKGNNINIDISECNSAATDGLDNCSEATAAKIDSLIAIKQKELKNWEEMIAQKKEEYKILETLCQSANLGAKPDTLCGTTDTGTSALKSNTSRTYKEKEDILVSIYSLTDLHLKDKKLSRIHVRRKDKWSWRMLNTTRFREFSWGIFEETRSNNHSGGWLKCGICTKAKTLGCLIWQTPTKQDMWVEGTNDWDNYSGSRKWELHAISQPHKQSVDFLINRDQHQIQNDIDLQAKGQLADCQVRNRYFFAKGVMTNIKFLGKKGLPLFGDGFGKGMLADVLQHIGNEYDDTIGKHLKSTKRSKNIVRPMHSNDVHFVLRKFADQIRTMQYNILNKSKFMCIIADEWSDSSSKEYCSVSARCVMENLTVHTVFLGYFRLQNIRAITVAEAIVKSFNVVLPKVNIRVKVIAQTYDGASNMQGHLSGVQKILRDNYTPFGIQLHCINHQVQITVKNNNKGHNLITRITDNCFVIVKIIKYSPKRTAMLEKIKKEIHDAVDQPKHSYASLKRKILDFCVTRWTVRARSLENILCNYEGIVSLFARLLTDKEERQGLNADKIREITGLVQYLQKFEFFIGLRLSILLYKTVDRHATMLQGDNVNISVAIRMVVSLVRELESHKDNFDEFWEKVIEERLQINESVNNNCIIRDFNAYDEIEQPSCPRAQVRALTAVSEDTPEKIYWKELYLDGFKTILEDLNERLESPQLKLCAEIEELLLNGILAPDKEVVTVLITKHYGSGTGESNAPIEKLNDEKIIEELTFLRNQWVTLKKDEEPDTFKDIVDMVEESITSNMPLRFWKHEAPNVLNLIQIIMATAGTSAYAERTFSLARRLKTWLRLGMDDSMFDALGLMAWYKDDLDKMLDLVKVGNEYIRDCKDNTRSKNYGIKFTKEDFITKTYSDKL